MRKILIVEDNPINLELVYQLLEDDYEIFTAIDGYEAIEQAFENDPDLILMDLLLPRLNGWEATIRLRSDPRTSKTPIIALTAQAVQAELDRAIASGCDECITKPIDEDALLAAIRRRLAAG
jgi:two-component system cell cycle response regulator DivK